MIDITPAARSSRRGLALEHMNEGGRIVGGCCVGERAMAPILESCGHQRRDQNARTGVAREVERRRTRVNNFQPCPIGIDLNPVLAIERPQKAGYDV